MSDFLTKLQLLLEIADAAIREYKADQKDEWVSPSLLKDLIKDYLVLDGDSA